jgi:hypothetical protein
MVLPTVFIRPLAMSDEGWERTVAFNLKAAVESRIRLDERR